MTTAYTLPIQNSVNQSFAVTFPDGTLYNLRLIYGFDPLNAWILDISDASGNPIVCGIAVVTGTDLLAPYVYLGFKCGIFAATEGDILMPPTWWNLEITGQIYIATNP